MKKLINKDCFASVIYSRFDGYFMNIYMDHKTGQTITKIYETEKGSKIAATRFLNKKAKEI